MFLSPGRDKGALVDVAGKLQEQGFELIATGERLKPLRQRLKVKPVLKVHEGRPNIEDAIRSDRVQMIINTPSAASRPRRSLFAQGRPRLPGADRHHTG